MVDARSESAKRSGGLYMDAKLPEFLDHFNVDLVLDVGANQGQFARELLNAGFSGRIVSFEPLSDAHAKLLANSRGNAQWTVADRCAIGDRTGTAMINVAGNSQSSSLLGMLDVHEQAAPASRYVGTERVALRRLDEVGAAYVAAARAPFLKIDVQGYEDRVIGGASGLLLEMLGLQLEMSLVPLYEGERVFEFWLPRLRSFGFELWWLRPGFTDKVSGRALQVDGIFFRSVGGVGT